MISVAYKIVWLPHARIRWGLYRGDDALNERPLGTFDNWDDAHDAMMKIIGSPHKFDAQGNRL